MGDLSAHFSRAEFMCKGHGQPGHRAHPTSISWQVVAKLEDLRAVVGKPLRIVSGHRCAWWNARQGGARRSRHLISDAADIPEGYATVEQAEAVGFAGIGNLGQWAVHVDTRPTPARWHY